MAIQTYQVISEVKKKKSDGSYDFFKLGPDLKYIGALKNSNNNNLEEQLILGSDRIIKTWYTNEDNYLIRKKIIEFRKEEVDNDYYILDITTYGDYNVNDIAENQNITEDDLSGKGNIYVYNNMIYLNEVMTSDSDNSAAVEDSQTGQFTYEDGKLYIFPKFILEKYILRYKDSEGNIIDIAKKDIDYSTEEEVQDEVTIIKKVMKEKVTKLA